MKVKGWVAALIIGAASIPLVVVLIVAAVDRITAPEPPQEERPSTMRPVATRTPRPTQPPDNEDPGPTQLPNPEYKPQATPTPEAAPEATPTPMPGFEPPTDITNDGSPLSAQLDSIAEKYNCKAVSLAYLNEDGEMLVYYYGDADTAESRPVNADTKFRVGSLSKLIPAICALRMAQDELIDLDEDISIYLGYTVANPEDPTVPITSRMLLQHTSSIFDSEAFLASRNQNAATTKTTGDLLVAGSSFRPRTPGMRFEDSNFGISITAAVCESRTGRLIDTIARDIIFTPLEIDAAYMPENLKDNENIAAIYNANQVLSRSVQTQLNTVSSGIPGVDHHLAQGNLTVSAKDYARIIAMLVNNGTLGGKEILSEASVRMMHNADVTGSGFMQGLAVRYQHASEAFSDDNIYWHAGSMYGELTQVVYSLDTKKAVVVLTTGAKDVRLNSGMHEVCTELAKAVWE